MYENNNLTEAAFIGGFADQPHFSRTYKSVFGNKPSSSENKNSQFIQV
jgi:transcriptional regulator GlxA family with amidase domain